ncbi:MAG: GTP 3',8-cyclase MoaA [Candidatus Hodarchaeales archaeon]|jgi:cyclic pyranopterin phosphate synthase
MKSMSSGRKQAPQISNEGAALVDPSGRPTTHMRISITNQCDMACPYCHREGHLAERKLLSLQKIRKIVEIASKRGIHTIKLTGGEPLLREDIIPIVDAISKVEGIREVSITTNGTHLEQLAHPLKQAGLKRINIGCDALSSSVLKKNVSKIHNALSAAKNAGFKNIKLNMVVLKGLNDHEIDVMIAFARKEQVTLQLIELMDADPEFYAKYFVDLGVLEKVLASKAMEVNERKLQARKRYHLDDVVVEVVRSHSSKFCAHCSKIRVTSDGYFKACLRREDNLVPINNEDIEINLIEAVRRRVPYVND